MKNLFRCAAIAAGLTLGLAACAKDAPPADAPQFSFTNGAPFTLKGTAVTIENAYVPNGALPSVESAYRINPSDIARAWARDRLRVSGNVGRVVIRILDASVVEDTLPTQHGYVGYLAGEQNRQFNARLKVDILIYGDAREKQPGRVSAEATASRAIAGNAGGRAAEADYYTLLESLARDFDGALSAQLSAYTVGY